MRQLDSLLLIPTHLNTSIQSLYVSHMPFTARRQPNPPGRPARKSDPHPTRTTLKLPSIVTRWPRRTVKALRFRA